MKLSLALLALYLSVANVLTQEDWCMEVDLEWWQQRDEFFCHMFTEEDICYCIDFMHYGQKSRQRADELCEEIGGHLAVVDTDRKLGWLNQHFYMMLWLGQAYVGLETINGEWTWVGPNGNKPATELNWHPDHEPNDDDIYGTLHKTEEWWKGESYEYQEYYWDSVEWEESLDNFYDDFFAWLGSYAYGGGYPSYGGGYPSYGGYYYSFEPMSGGGYNLGWGGGWGSHGARKKRDASDDFYSLFSSALGLSPNVFADPDENEVENPSIDWDSYDWGTQDWGNNYYYYYGGSDWGSYDWGNYYGGYYYDWGNFDWADFYEDYGNYLSYADGDTDWASVDWENFDENYGGYMSYAYGGSYLGGDWYNLVGDMDTYWDDWYGYFDDLFENYDYIILDLASDFLDSFSFELDDTFANEEFHDHSVMGKMGFNTNNGDGVAKYICELDGPPAPQVSVEGLNNMLAGAK